MELSWQSILTMLLSLFQNILSPFADLSVGQFILIVVSLIVGVFFLNGFWIWLSLKILKHPATYSQCLLTELYVMLSAIGFSLIPVIGSIISIFFGFWMFAERHTGNYWRGGLVWLLSNLLPGVVYFLIFMMTAGITLF